MGSTPQRQADPLAEDRAMARAAAEGDADAQRKLIERVLPHLRAVSRAVLGGRPEAEDAMQIAAMKVLQNAHQYRGEAPVERWARRVGTRACLDLARKQRRLAEVPEEKAPVPATASDPKLREQLPQPLQVYLDRLPEAQRQAVILRHALDYTVAEVAELLDVPVDTAKSRLLYGRRTLRKLIRQDQNVGELKLAREGAG